MSNRMSLQGEELMTIEYGTDVKMTPLARRAAADRGLDVSAAQGSGYAGKIFYGDLDNMTIAFTAPGGEWEAPSHMTSAIEVQGSSVLYFPYEATAASNANLLIDAAAGSMERNDGIIRIARNDDESVTEDEGPSTGAMIAAAITADKEVAGVMRMNDVRRATAELTAKSSAQTAAVTQHIETDVTELFALLERVNVAREKQEQIPLVAFYIKAIAVCVKEKERFRMRLAEAEDAYLLMEGAHIGLQLGAGDNVVTPVLRDVDLKSIKEIAVEVVSLYEKVKLGAIFERERRGGAITLIDKGDCGIFAFTPIIKQPESAILGIGAPYQKLVMTEKSIENRQFVMQSLTFDHRVINGHEADEFQRRLKEILESPALLVG